MIPDTTYEIKQYIRNGRRIDCLQPRLGAPEFYLMMTINTPIGMISQSPMIDADNIDDAFAKCKGVEDATMEAVKSDLASKGVIPGGIVVANQIPPAIQQRMGPGGPIPGIKLP